MLGALAVIALIVGGISATVSVTETGLQTHKQAGQPVVEVKAVEVEKNYQTH